MDLDKTELPFGDTLRRVRDKLYLVARVGGGKLGAEVEKQADALNAAIDAPKIPGSVVMCDCCRRNAEAALRGSK